MLFTVLKDVHLRTDHDCIRWKWMADGCYSVKSAYDIQFAGAIKSHVSSAIWRARTEPKCRFLAWLVMHNKTLTADNLAKKNWPHNQTCLLCYCAEETAGHLFSQCNFTKAVWGEAATRLQLPQECRAYDPHGPIHWIQAIQKNKGKAERRKLLGILFSFWWQL